jgi:hypothetical protein
VFHTPVLGSVYVLGMDIPNDVINHTLKFLNELVETDPEAMRNLVETRVPCNQALADHPTVQVRSEEGQCSVGLLGILNGLLGTDTDGWGFICAVYGDDLKLQRFARTPPRKKANP